jgi:hypothetical protein
MGIAVGFGIAYVLVTLLSQACLIPLRRPCPCHGYT